MIGDFMSKMKSVHAPKLGWYGATIHSRQRGFATAAVRSCAHGHDYDCNASFTGRDNAIHNIVNCTEGDDHYTSGN